MKMNVQNPGGEDMSERRMKGSEKYQAQGKGDMKPYPVPSPMKKQSLASPTSTGLAKNAHVRNTGHALTSMTGSFISGKQTGNS